jgi:hypothetical protein
MSRGAVAWTSCALVSIIGLTVISGGVAWRLVRRPTVAAELPVDPRHCRTPEELCKACAELLEPYPPVGHTGRPAPVGKEPPRLFIVKYLDSPDPALRDAAVDVLARAPKPVPSSAFTKYLSERYPRDLRAVALARSLDMIRSQEEFAADGGRPMDPSRREQMKPLWSEIFAELTRDPDPPAHFYALAARLKYRYAEQAIPEHDVPRIVQWCLGLLSREPEADGVTMVVRGFADEVVEPQLVKWYPAEKSRNARLRAVREYASENERDRWPRFRRFFELAARDNDREIADTVRRALTSPR